MFRINYVHVLNNEIELTRILLAYNVVPDILR
jgi:hypothetical protein